MTAQPQATEFAALLARLQHTYAARGEETLASEITLAQAAARDVEARQEHPDQPLQLALLGPTQVGKSTVANLLLGAAAAEVSPLAGFTIHPQGFQSGGESAAWAEPHFVDWQRVSQTDLQRDALQQYVLSYVPAATPPTDRPTVVWDTPDFDSLRSHQYIGSVFRVVALADVLVLVLSREKYSDLAVWETLQLLAPLGRPLVVCLNKADAAVQEQLTDALRQRLQEFLPGQTDAPIVCLPPYPNLGETPLADCPPEVQTLRAAVAARAAQVKQVDRAAGVERLRRERGPRWIAPVEAEYEAQQAWERELLLSLAEAERTYRRDYLEHPKRFDTFQRAIGELLTLLEVPGVAGTLTQIRQVLTWPARQLFAGRTWWQSKDQAHSGGSEELVLRDVLDRFFLHTQRGAVQRLSEPGAGAWWQAVHQELDRRQSDLRGEVEQAIARYQERFQAEIQETARKLYAALQERPALLNTLRAARTTADAASIALAVKTAGLGVDALLLAPAMVGVTSMLTEGALGTYMQTVAQKLRDAQLDALRQEVLQPALVAPLQRMPEQLGRDELFCLNEAEYAALQRWLGGTG